MSFFGLYIPTRREDATKLDSADAAKKNPTFKRSEKSAFVFCKKVQALVMLKEYKDARMREFSTEDEAVEYAQTGYEAVPLNKHDDTRTSTVGIENEVFRAPIKQALSAFRRLIESGEWARVKSTVWENPRYLVSSGGTPTTLKEGCRYNALHICAISSQPKIAELILQTVSDWKFVNLLTGSKNDESMCKELCSNLLDYYLNMPEKGRSETPLHLASKYGDLETAQVLVSYPECKMTRNNAGSYPIDIICTRRYNNNVSELKVLLRDRFYVPVLRSDDSSVPPEIGEPFSLNNPPPKINCDPLSPEVKVKALAGPMDEDKAKQLYRRWKTPPRINNSGNSSLLNNSLSSPKHMSNSPKTPTNSSVSCVGTITPNSKDHRITPNANLQRRLFLNSSTPQSKQNGCSISDSLEQSLEENVNGAITPLETMDAEDIITSTEAAGDDQQNGNEEYKTDNVFMDSLSEVENKNNNNHILPNLSKSLIKPPSRSTQALLCPQTPLLKMKKNAFFLYREQHVPSPIFLDMSCAEKDFKNLSLGSNNGQDCRFEDSTSYKERNIKLTDTDKGLEVIGRQLARDYNVEWREYWDFLDEFIDISSVKGRSKLEDYLGTRMKDEELAKRTKAAIANSSAIIDDVVSALEKFGFRPSSEFVTASTQKTGGSKRNVSATAQKLTHAITPQSTMPYTCVEKSLQVFAKRMTKTIINNIDNVVSINDTLLSELKRLKSLICSFKDDLRFSDVCFERVHSRIGNLVSIYLNTSQGFTDLTNAKIQNSIKNLLATPGERREHIECVCIRIAFMLERPTEQILPEILKTEDMCAEIWLQENVCDCQWENNLSRKPTRRHRNDLRSKYSPNPFTTKLDDKKENVSPVLNVANELISSIILDDPIPDELINDVDIWISPGEESDSSNDNETFWSDFGSSDTDGDEDCWRTPPESPQQMINKKVEEKTDAFTAYIFGKEPTKRDLDVWYAIQKPPTATIEITKTTYPNTYAWKTALLNFTKEEMQDFPSPITSPLKKSQSSYMLRNNQQQQQQAEQHQQQQHLQQEQQQHKPQIPIAKRLFSANAPQQRPKSIAAISTNINMRPQAFMTPTTKKHGLYTAYRDKPLDSPISPFSTSNNSDDNNLFKN